MIGSWSATISGLLPANLLRTLLAVLTTAPVANPAVPRAKLPRCWAEARERPGTCVAMSRPLATLVSTLRPISSVTIRALEPRTAWMTCPLYFHKRM